MGTCDFISSSEGATLCLKDIVFPASKDDILRRIEESGGSEAVIVAANRLPDKTYDSLEELVTYLEAQ